MKRLCYLIVDEILRTSRFETAKRQENVCIVQLLLLADCLASQCYASVFHGQLHCIDGFLNV